MYIPELFKNKNIEEVKSFIAANAFGILVRQGKKITATHIPLLLSKNPEGRDILLGHISRANHQLDDIDANEEVLVIFQGPHTYVSSSWYAHENVPTWNYIAVHVYGKVRIMEGEALRAALKQLVDKYEAHSEKPVSVDKMSPSFIQKEMKGIVGFEISIEHVEAAYKLSQNRNAKDHGNIIAELEKRKDQDSFSIADQMKQKAPKE